MRSICLFFSVSTISVFMSASLLPAGPIPPPPDVSWPVFPGLGTSDATASALFTPMQESETARDACGAGKYYVELPCHFEGTSHTRASWDIAVSADLAVAQGVQFLFYCADAAPISHFSFYFHSNAGWYAASFGISHEGKWCRVTVDKSQTRIEDTPAGWGTVDTFRISAWRGVDRNTTCAIAALGPVGSNPEVLVIRGDSAGNTTEAKSVSVFADNVMKCLNDVGIPCALISDGDATAERLFPRKMAILPHNPQMPESLLPLLKEYVDQGGKILSFYSLPAELAEILDMERGGWEKALGGRFQGMVKTADGLQGQPEFVPQASWNAHNPKPIPGKSVTIATWRTADGKDSDIPAIVASSKGAHVGHVLLTDGWGEKKRLFLALIGRYIPGVWERATQQEIARIGVIADFGGYEEFVGALPAISGPLRDALRAAKVARERALALQKKRQWPEAIAAAQGASLHCLEAWCLNQKSEPGEHRAFWCHSAFGLPDKTWEESIKFLAESGFNAILPNMLWGGTAYYPSSVLPVHESVLEKGDQIDLCLKACRKFGVECHVWKVNWNMGSHADPAFIKKMGSEQRVQKQFSGEIKERWLCPSHPDNQKLEVDAMVELAEKYALDGIHFDYIRYPGGDYCFCEGCRKRFSAFVGHEIPNWPGAVREDETLKQQWLDFRRSNITSVVARTAERARKVRPGIKISAAVFRNWPVDRDGVGQDWKLWCDRGYLDFVCPMDYTDSNTTFRSQVQAQLGYAGQVPCYPGIGLSCWRNPTDIVKLVEQINITRRLKTGGFTVFNYDHHAVNVLPLSAMGVTRGK